jgi:hypothetical protein
MTRYLHQFGGFTWLGLAVEGVISMGSLGDALGVEVASIAGEMPEVSRLLAVCASESRECQRSWELLCRRREACKAMIEVLLCSPNTTFDDSDCLRSMLVVLKHAATTGGA